MENCPSNAQSSTAMPSNTSPANWYMRNETSLGPVLLASIAGVSPECSLEYSPNIPRVFIPSAGPLGCTASG